MKHFIDFMQRVLDEKHAEPAPPSKEGEETWYLPIFGVYHLQKPGQIRVVFNSSVKHKGISLSDILMSGPDLNNTLLGVLICFCREPIAVTADVQRCSTSSKSVKNIETFWCSYGMKTAIYKNLWKSFERQFMYWATVHYQHLSFTNSGELLGKQMTPLPVQEFITRNFYVNDKFEYFPSEAEAICVLRPSQAISGLLSSLAGTDHYQHQTGKIENLENLYERLRSWNRELF